VDELLTIAEIAVTLAGFAGVVVAFLHRGELHAVDRIRFVNFFTIAFEAVILAFVPIALSHLEFEGSRLWVWSSAFMIGLWTLHMMMVPLFLARVLGAMRVVSPFPTVLMLVPAFVNVAVQLVNATGWLHEPGFVPYLFGLFVYLYSAGVSFVYMVIFRPAEGPGANT